MRVNFLQFYTEILLKWLLNPFHAEVKKFSQCLVSFNWPITNRTGAVGFGPGTVWKGKWVLGQLLCIALYYNIKRRVSAGPQATMENAWFMKKTSPSRAITNFSQPPARMGMHLTIACHHAWLPTQERTGSYKSIFIFLGLLLCFLAHGQEWMRAAHLH